MAKKSNGYTVPGYQYKLGGLAMVTNNDMQYPNPLPQPHQFKRTQNGMMGMEYGGFLDYMEQNPALAMMTMGGYPPPIYPQNMGGVESINDIGGYPSAQPHKGKGSTMNGASWSKYGGPQQYMPEPLEYAYLEYGGAVDDNDMAAQMKDGGIHIKKSAVGSLHTHLGVPQGEKIPASKLAIKPGDSPAIRKKKQFAINAKHFHHKYGGLAKFMDNGGAVELPDNGNTITGTVASDPTMNPNNQGTMTSVNQGYQDTVQATGNTPTYIDNSGAPRVTTDYLSNGNDSGTNPNYQVTPQQGQQQPKQRVPWGQVGSNLLGAGLMTASYFEDQRNQRNAQGYNRQLGMSDNMPKYNNPDSHGQYTQQGIYKPDSYVPTKQNIQYPHMQIGGYMKDTVHEMDDATIQKLQKMGYKLQVI